MQGELFDGFEVELWRAVEVRTVQMGIERVPIYVKTEPLNWRQPEQSDRLPWEA